MLSNLLVMWYAAVAPAFGRVFSGGVLALIVCAGEAYGYYPEGTFVIVALVLFLYTDIVRLLLRESGARSLALYSVGVIVLYVGVLAFGRWFLGGGGMWLPLVLWTGELCIGAGVIQWIARPERILHARQERYAKVEEVFRF